MAYTIYDYPKLDYVLFGSGSSKHSYKNFGLVLDRAEVETPKRITTYITTANGVIDVTDSVTSVARYDNRNITLQFKVLDGNKSEWNTIYSNIVKEIHGKHINDIYISSRNRFYSGRCHVDKYLSSEFFGTIVVKIVALPETYIEQTQLLEVDFKQDATAVVNLNLDSKIFLTGDELYFQSNSSYIDATTTFTEEGEVKKRITTSSTSRTSFGKIKSSGRTVAFSYGGTSTPSSSIKKITAISRRVLIE